MERAKRRETAKRLQVLGAVLAAAALVGLAGFIGAAPGRLPAGRPLPARVVVAVQAPTDAWGALDDSQRRTLAPLRSRWDGMDERTRARWVEVAERLQGKPFAVLERAMRHMAAWQRLPPAQRAQARLNYRLAASVPAAERQRRWASWQARERGQAVPGRPPSMRMVAPSLARSEQGATSILLTELPPDAPAHGPVAALPASAAADATGAAG